MSVLHWSEHRRAACGFLGDSTSPALWLSSIARTGQDTSAGGSTAAITLPPVVFAGTPLSNRVDLSDGYPPITRQRLTTITTETGETISVGYSSPGCASGTPADPAQNTALCYPDYWLPAGQTQPVLDWFNKFIVTGVTEEDPTGGSAHDTIATTYTPVGTPAWHYTEDPTRPAGERTWDQWRGFQGIVVTTGTAPDNTAAITTYNLTIDGIHTYYVDAGTTPVLVHNCGEDIVGTTHDSLRPTQDYVNPRTVDQYAAALRAGEKIPPIEVQRLPNGNEYIYEGHHRYVASMRTGIPVDREVTEGEGPVGLPDWSKVTYQQWFGEP